MSHANLQGWKGTWILNSIMWPMIQSIMPTEENPGHWSLVELPGWWAQGCVGKVMPPDSTGRAHGSSVFRTLPGFALCVFSFGWSSWFVSFTVIASMTFSWVLWVVLANYQTWGGVIGTPQICSHLEQVAWGPPNLWLASEVRVVLLGTVPLTWESNANSRWLVSELCCSIPVICVISLSGPCWDAPICVIS